jgi:predicted component of type VI protein secretion system
MPAQLIALNDGPSILLDKPILLLGRHPECDIQIDSRKVSRRHCCIAQVKDYLLVRDLGSTNGIRINGVRVSEGRLMPGDELTIGNHRYQVSWDSSPASTPPRQRARETQRPAPDGAAADEILESSDEPVPLPEPDDYGNVPTPRSQDLPPLPVPPDEESFVLPEHLELMPGSEVFRELSNPSPSGSHPAAP